MYIRSHSEKANVLKKIGYKNQKKRGIDPGDKVLKFLCNKYNITVNKDKDWFIYSRTLDSPENSWVFRVTFAFNPFTSWDHIDMICDFIQEDIEDCGNSKYWPGFKI